MERRGEKLYDEKGIINLFRQIVGNGLYDDVGYLKIGDKYILYNIDTFVKSTDAPKNMRHYFIGWKSVIGSISDIFVKGGVPRYLGISINLSSVEIEEIKELAEGVKDVITEYRLEVIKWDTNKSEDLSITVSAFGISSKPPVLRKGVKVGDVVFATDFFGLERLGLEIILEKVKIGNEKLRNAAITRFLKPVINQDIYKTLFSRISVNAAIDSSDGLARSLWELSISSNRKIKIRELPIHPLLIQSNLNEEYLRRITLYGGEEYIGLFSIPPEEEALCKKLGLIPIGNVVGTGIGVYDEKGNEITDKGWLHRF